ncbi:cation transport ATPase [Tabrizicola sp.]|uniref:cation transport ATPase n=1 Tax=Tabrizicola sp. TaxID=2005166 RepID=UPI003D2CE495
MVRSLSVLAWAGFVLTACVEAVPTARTSTVSVLQGSFTVAAASGYCIDTQAGRERNDSGAYLIGRCVQQSQVAPALITLSVGQPGSAGVMNAGGAELAAFFTSEEGRATLSSNGRASALRVLDARSAGDVFVMRLQDRNAPSYWRAVFALRGRLVSVSVKGGGDAALPEIEGRSVLDSAVAALQRANRV